MVVIEQVRPGVEFTPAAADAFRRAEGQVLSKLGRRIDVNSTYRSWAEQMKMFIDWQNYIHYGGPYPGHSKAVHPSESFHVSGLALDSDDWTNPTVLSVLAENGFIRNRLYVPNEQHHFEYIESRDQNKGKPSGGGNVVGEIEDDMAYIANVKNGNFYCVTGTKAHKLGAASGARQSGMPILNYPDDWAVAQLKTVVTGIGNH